MVAITTPLTTTTGVNDIYIAGEIGRQFAIIATTSGIESIDLQQGHVVSSGLLPVEPKCITADWQTAGGKLYIGTAGSGIFSMSWVKVREPLSDFSESLVQRFTTATTPSVSSNTINDLDAIPGELLIGTSAGVDYICNETESATRALSGGSPDVHMTSTGGGYWTNSSGVEVNYDLTTTTGTSIIDVDFEYTVLSTPSLPGEPPVDIAVSESTGNLAVLAFATTSGSIVVEENPGNEAASNSKVITNTDNANSVDFSGDASYSNGCLYTTTASQLFVVELAGNTVSGTHGVSTGTRDQTLITGTLAIVRTTEVGECP